MNLARIAGFHTEHYHTAWPVRARVWPELPMRKQGFVRTL